MGLSILQILIPQARGGGPCTGTGRTILPSFSPRSELGCAAKGGSEMGPQGSLRKIGLTPEELRGTLPFRPKVLERWSYLSFQFDLSSEESTISRLSQGKGAKNIVTSLGGIQARPTDGNWHGMALYTLSSWRRRNLNSDEFVKMLHIILNKRMGDRSRSAYTTEFNLLWSWIAWQLATFL